MYINFENTVQTVSKAILLARGEMALYECAANQIIGQTCFASHEMKY